MAKYRSWAQRRQIIAAMIAQDSKARLDDFGLTPSEEVFFRARSRRAVDAAAIKTSFFKAYYSLPTYKPFLYILGLTLIIVAGGVASGAYLFLRRRADVHLYPLLGSSATITVGAIGWCVAAWISHRNAVRQNTTNLIFARFSQTAYTESLHRFHTAFGYSVEEKVTMERLFELRSMGVEDARNAEAVNYVLNYFEFICAGVLSGDLDADIIRNSIRGILIYYYDKCEPFIRFANASNRKAFESLIKVRTHYREP